MFTASAEKAEDAPLRQLAGVSACEAQAEQNVALW